MTRHDQVLSCQPCCEETCCRCRRTLPRCLTTGNHRTHDQSRVFTDRHPSSILAGRGDPPTKLTAFDAGTGYSPFTRTSSGYPNRISIYKPDFPGSRRNWWFSDTLRLFVEEPNVISTILESKMFHSKFL